MLHPILSLHRRPIRLAVSTLLLPVLALAASAARAQDSTAKPPAAPIFTGVYNNDQASRGEATYNSTCSACHETADYTGEKFAKSWVGKTAFDLFETLRTTMPDDNPGSLSRDQYVDVVAYLFKLNGYPAGDSTLVADDEKLRVVKIEAKPATPSETGAAPPAPVSRAVRDALRVVARRAGTTPPRSSAVASRSSGRAAATHPGPITATTLGRPAQP